MRKRAIADEYYAMISDDNGTVRGKIPSPLVREMGARPGDQMVFRKDEFGNAIMILVRNQAGKRKSARKPARKSRKRR